MNPFRKRAHGAYALLLCCLVLALNSGIVSAKNNSEDSKRQWIRFYQANKMLQTDRVQSARKKGRLLGCHNLVKNIRVYKLVIFGFGSCKIYTKKHCEEGSETDAKREKDTLGTLELAAGYGWYPSSEHERGKKIRSWSCSETPAPKLPRKKLLEEKSETSQDSDDSENASANKDKPKQEKPTS